MDKKILVINRCFSSNLGDQEIARVVSNLIETELQARVERVDLTSARVFPIPLKSASRMRPLRIMVKRFVSARFFWMRNTKRVWRETGKNYDFAVIGGGELFMPGVFIFALAFWAAALYLRSTPLLVMNIGARGRFDWLDRVLIRMIVGISKGVTVRDPDSYRNVITLLNSQDAIKKVKVSYDIVFAEGTLPELGASARKGPLVLGVVDWFFYRSLGGVLTRGAYYEWWWSYLQQVPTENGIQEVALAYTTAEDYLECQQFYAWASRRFPKIDITLTDVDDVSQFKSVLRAAPWVVSGRMHFLLLAAQHGCDYVAVPISDKITAFNHQLLNADLSCIANEVRANFVNDIKVCVEGRELD